MLEGAPGEGWQGAWPVPKRQLPRGVRLPKFGSGKSMRTLSPSARSTGDETLEATPGLRDGQLLKRGPSRTEEEGGIRRLSGGGIPITMEDHTPSKSKSTVFVGGISWKVSDGCLWAPSKALSRPLGPLRVADACIPRERQADEEGLRQYFEQFGTVLECKIIFDRATNKSKGYV